MVISDTLKYVASIGVIIAFTYGLLYGLVRYFKKEKLPVLKKCAGISAAFSFLGFTIGMNIGQSMTPAVAPVMSGTLTLIGGLAAYLFVKDNSENNDNRLMVVCLIICLSIFILYGEEVGEGKRTKYEKELIKNDTP